MEKIIFIIGIIAGSLTTISFLPQVLQIYKTKSTKSLSLSTFVIFCMGVSAWLVYGILILDWPIIIANSITLALIGTIILMKMKYG